MSRESWLRGLLVVGVVYLCLIGGAHFLGVKIPALYIYYDISSTIYQDRIIGTLCFAMAALLFGVFKTVNECPRAMGYTIVAALVIPLGFCFNTLFSPDVAENPIYWLQILGLAVYAGLLVAAYSRHKTRSK